MMDDRTPIAQRTAPEKVAANGLLHNNIRSMVALFAGSACGIIGFDGIYGLLFFAASMALLSYFLMVKTSFKPTTYFASQWSVWTDGVVQALMTYVLFWTMLYNIVHVY